MVWSSVLETLFKRLFWTSALALLYAYKDRSQILPITLAKWLALGSGIGFLIMLPIAPFRTKR
ncbi:hypothetical protein [Methylomicrobium lacus]|uniref:hypothetical protein n=1 Tax=Methylomicrobium lacus TaxID=136992 RepID=UPI00045E886D|nr:hypothetical protein [Methylomicrobium lacus]